jgi:signal transduction histidine kinase
VVWNSAGTLGVLVLAVVVLDRLRAYVESEQRERRYAVEQLRRAERLNIIGRLAAGVAHELGTPLNVISGSAELLQTQRLSPEKKDALLETIRGQAGRISRIVRQLLDFGRGNVVPKEGVELNDLGRTTAGLLQNTAQRRNCSIVFESLAPAIRVVANASELEQVLSNLVLNGLQAMSRGGVLRLSVDNQTRPDASGNPTPYGALVVEDEGIGIAASDLPRIFDPFFSTKEVGEGTGLGLSISYGIIRDHGGLLEVASREEGGTRFTALLPLALESR